MVLGLRKKATSETAAAAVATSSAATTAVATSLASGTLTHPSIHGAAAGVGVRSKEGGNSSNSLNGDDNGDHVSVCSTITPKGAVSLGAGSIGVHIGPSSADDANNARTPSISNKRRPHLQQLYDRTGDDDDEEEDQSVCGSVVSVGSVSACSSLGVGTLLPLPVQQQQQEQSQLPPSSKENTPTSSNKAILGSQLVGLLPSVPSKSSSSSSSLYNQGQPSSLLAANVSAQSDDHHNHDDAIRVLSGHSASHSAAAVRSATRSVSPASSASTGPLFLPTTIGGKFPTTHFRRNDGLEPIRQQHYHGSASSLLGQSLGCDAADDTSTLVSGISCMDQSEVGGRSPRRGTARHYGGADTTSSINTGTTSNRSRRGGKKMRNPFRRRKKKRGGEGGRDGDSVSAFSGASSHMISDVSDLGSIATARSGRSHMSISTMGSTSSRLSAFAKKIKPRRMGKKKKKGREEHGSPSGSVSKEVTVPTTPERSPAGKSTPSGTGMPSCSDPSTPIRSGSAEKRTKESPAHSLNTTLPTVDSYEEEDDNASTYSSVISGLSAGGTSSATSQRMDRITISKGYQQQGRRRKKDIGADDFPPVYFETKRTPLLTLEESFDEEEERHTGSFMGASTTAESREDVKNHKVPSLLDDVYIPTGLSCRASTQEIMSRLAIPTELGNRVLHQVRRQHDGSGGSSEHGHQISTADAACTNGSSEYSPIPHVVVCDILIPDYGSYVQTAVDSFRKRLGITDELYDEIICSV